MKLTFLGTCSGTEPQPGFRHMSFVIEHADSLYWFEAGEGCSYTAHLSGIDIMSTRAVFITHPHMDHVGGLGNLLWNIRKLNSVGATRGRMTGKTIDLCLPDMVSWEGLLQFLSRTQVDFTLDYTLHARQCCDGVVFEEDGFKVTALHNWHIGKPEPGEGWRSFSYVIEADGRRVVYSGDLVEMAEIDSIMDDADLLLIETGHHAVEKICNYLVDTGKRFGSLGFVHHGRAILADPAGELNKARSILGDRVFIATDGYVAEHFGEPV